MSGQRRFDLIVTDTSPLITLAAADALNCLTMPGIRVLVPDMVYFEATRYPGKVGASAIVAWMTASPDLVRIEPTETFAEFQLLLLHNPDAKTRGRGEQAAVEVLRRHAGGDAEWASLLLFEDSDIATRRIAILTPERAVAVTTADFLKELEAARLIQSADIILDRAVAEGRPDHVRRATTNPGGALAASIEKKT